MSLIRTVMTDLNLSEQLTSQTIIDDMISYFTRQDDHTQIKASIKKRYGVGIKSVQDPKNSSAVIETYSKENITLQVDAGITEALSVGAGQKIVNARATLFTESGQKYTYTHDTKEDVEKAEELIKYHRDNGGYHSSVVAADRRSCQVGSSALLLGYAGDLMSYQMISPSDVTAYFGETIEDAGVIRTVDKTSIEDATAVVIRLSYVDYQTWNYLAIYGRSDIYPNGRYVQFQASNGLVELPAVGDKNIIDYEIEGAPANPLSYQANQNLDMNLPEYPIAIFDGGITDSGDLMPTTTSLFNDCLEFDTAASHLLSTSQDAARGTLALSKDAQAATKPIPRTLHGAICLEPGQSVEHIGHDATASETGMTVLKDLMVSLASGYSVPDYMMVSEDHALEAASGIALAIKTRPLKKDREQRIELNKHAVRKIYQIEQGLISLFSDAPEAELNELQEMEQTWDAGELKLPENKKELADRIIALMEKGVMDPIAAIREYNHLPTDQEAIEFYEKMRDRAVEYPSLAAAPKRTVGLLRGQQ